MIRLARSFTIAATAMTLFSACGGGDKDPDARPPIPDASDDPDAMVDADTGCTALTVTPPDISQIADGFISWTASGSPMLDDGEVIVQWEFYDGLGELTGALDLTAAPQDNYATCAACLRVFSVNADGTELVRQFFQSGGTMNLTESPFVNGNMLGSLDGVTLVEVTIDDEFNSTPVPGGGCITLGTTVALDANSVPLAWTCDDAAFNDGATCDCVCGFSDPDCGIPDAPVNGCTPTQACVEDVCVDPPANDTCATAETIVIGTPVTGTTVGATSDYDNGLEGDACTGFAQPGPDVAYVVTLTAGQAITVTMTPDVGSPNYDGAIAIVGPGNLNGNVCNADPIVCLTGADATLGGEAETFTFTATAAGNYFIDVDSYNPGVAGAFSLLVTSP